MLEDAAGICRVVLACGTVDLRKGIDRGKDLEALMPWYKDLPAECYKRRK